MKRDYPCVEVNLGKITHNTSIINSLCGKRGIAIAGVSKVFCAKKPVVEAMLRGGLLLIGDSRIENLKLIKNLSCKKMLLRIPMKSNAGAVVKYSDISLNSEINTIKKLNAAAKRLGKIHDIILMVDLGDLREGVLEKDVLTIAGEIIKLENIRLYGIGTNLTCYGGVIPDSENLSRLAALKSEIKNIFGIDLPVVSGGNSSSLYAVLEGIIPKGINQLRIGEAIVLGRETSFGRRIEGCFSDAFILKGEIIEIKDKPSVPTGRIGVDAFGQTPHFEDKGIIRRAIVALGRQDIVNDGLFPLDKNIEILGASSDHLILDITGCVKEYQIGDIVDFTMDYGCVLRSMTSPYVKKYYTE